MSASDVLALPQFLPLLLLAPLAWFALRRFDRGHARRRANLFGARGPTLAPTPGERRPGLRRALPATALFAALLAVLQPVWGEGAQHMQQRGIDLFVCLDVSRSMLARDLEPDRLTAARGEIAALAARARGDRLGLVVFAGEARLAVPLTQDVDSFVQLLEFADPLSVERGGTDLGAALDAARSALVGATGEHEAVLLISDGEDHEGRGLNAAEEFRARGIAVHCAGVGGSRGARIPTEDGDFLRDREGREVRTALEPEGLLRIAERTGGAYLPLSRGALVDLYESSVLPMARKALGDDERQERENRYQWPLLAAFLLWMLELCWIGRATAF